MHNRAGGPERAIRQLSEQFFDVFYYWPTAIQDAEIWRKGDLRVGLKEEQIGVPFVLRGVRVVRVPMSWADQLRAIISGEGGGRKRGWNTQPITQKKPANWQVFRVQAQL